MNCCDASRARKRALLNRLWIDPYRLHSIISLCFLCSTRATGDQGAAWWAICQRQGSWNLRLRHLVSWTADWGVCVCVCEKWHGSFSFFPILLTGWQKCVSGAQWGVVQDFSSQEKKCASISKHTNTLNNAQEKIYQECDRHAWWFCIK